MSLRFLLRILPYLWKGHYGPHSTYSRHLKKYLPELVRGGRRTTAENIAGGVLRTDCTHGLKNAGITTKNIEKQAKHRWVVSGTAGTEQRSKMVTYRTPRTTQQQACCPSLIPRTRSMPSGEIPMAVRCRRFGPCAYHYSCRHNKRTWTIHVEGLAGQMPTTQECLRGRGVVASLGSGGNGRPMGTSPLGILHARDSIFYHCWLL